MIWLEKTTSEDVLRPQCPFVMVKLRPVLLFLALMITTEPQWSKIMFEVAFFFLFTFAFRKCLR